MAGSATTGPLPPDVAPGASTASCAVAEYVFPVVAENTMATPTAMATATTISHLRRTSTRAWSRSLDATVVSNAGDDTSRTIGVVGWCHEFGPQIQEGCAHPMGPLRLSDLIGLDTTMAVAESLYDEFKEQLYAPPPLLLRMVEAGLLGRKAGRGFYSYG